MSHISSLLVSFDCLWHYALSPSSASPHLHFSSSLNTSRRPNLSSSALIPLAIQSSTPCQVASLRSLFSVMDADGDGRLSLCEMRSLLTKLHISSQSTDLESFIQHTSSTGHMDDGVSLDFCQFAQLYASLFGASHDSLTQDPALQYENDEFLDAFHVYDTNHDGFISAAELAAVLLELGLLDNHCGIDAHLRRCQAYIDSVDLNGDGMVDIEEFKCMMTHNRLSSSQLVSM